MSFGCSSRLSGSCVSEGNSHLVGGSLFDGGSSQGSSCGCGASLLLVERSMLGGGGGGGGSSLSGRLSTSTSAGDASFRGLNSRLAGCSARLASASTSKSHAHLPVRHTSFFHVSQRIIFLVGRGRVSRLLNRISLRRSR